MKVLGAYGKALADAGKLRQAAEILEKAHTPERPDWSILSTQGSIADQLGDHATARGYYEAALKIRPNEPSVLSNLGLSHALAKDLPHAEETLRLAAAQPGADARVRQNLALVLALQGKFPEAEELSRRDLSPLEAKQNVAAIRQMISQSDTWRDIQTVPAPTRQLSAPRPETSRN
jgi:Flp pilus assembly protein TadD